MTITSTSLDNTFRKVASVLIRGRLAYLSRSFSTYEYLGDPLIILYILSSLDIDEVCIIDLDASKSGILNTYLLKSLRSIADYPLSYAGGVRSITTVEKIFSYGYDRIVFCSQNKYLSGLVDFANQKYGKQAIAITIDYLEFENQRYIYCPYSRLKLATLLQDHIRTLPLQKTSDVIFTSVSRTGTTDGLDFDLLKTSSVSSLDNPVLLSGGLGNAVNRPLDSAKGFSGFYSSTSMFLQSLSKGSVMVSYNRLKSLE